MRPGYVFTFYLVGTMILLAATLEPRHERIRGLRLNLIALGLLVLWLPYTITNFKYAFSIDNIF